MFVNVVKTWFLLNKLWQCNNRKQHDNKRPTKGFYEGTFFSGSHLTPKQNFEFTYYWCRNTHSQVEFEHDMKISRNIIVDWKQFCRDIAVLYFQNHPEKIGKKGIQKKTKGRI